jgi:hypothetical protein
VDLKSLELPHHEHEQPQALDCALEELGDETGDLSCVPKNSKFKKTKIQKDRLFNVNLFCQGGFEIARVAAS